MQGVCFFPVVGLTMLLTNTENGSPVMKREFFGCLKSIAHHSIGIGGLSIGLLLVIASLLSVDHTSH